MNKELEALELIKEHCKVNGLDITDRPSYEHLLKALTPPTEEEVCEALSEYYGKKVIFKHNSFHIRYERHTEILVINHLTDKPHLITMIGRFYKGVIENE